ncbi:MAG: four helix bundle protein, partial [Bacteroidota bacterium]
LRSIKLFQNLPKTDEARIIGKQFLRSATSVGANYRASCRARSEAEFHSKISIVTEEADESAFWLEIIIDAGVLSAKRVEPLLKEAIEILSVVSKARFTTEQNKSQKNRK